MKTSSRLALIGAAAFLALSAGLALPAAAETTSNVDMNITALDPANILTLVQTESAAAPVIVDLQSILGANSGVTTTDDTNVITEEVVLDNDVFDESSNVIFSRTRGNNADNTVGIADTAGAQILVGQEIVPDGVGGVTALSATTNDNLIIGLLSGGGQNVTATMDNNVVEARTSFNTNFATIETDIPNDLVPGADGTYNSELTIGGLDTGFFFPTDVDQTANFNVASVQAISGVANGNAANLTTSSVDDTVIALGRFNTDTATISGSFSLDGNAVNGETSGNAADNSIFLETGEATSFAGTAFVSSTQLSQDNTTPTGDFPAISASNEDTTIIAVFADEAFDEVTDIGASLVGAPDFTSADGLAATVDGNSITSSATINSTRNELGLDSALAIAGGDSDTNITMGVGNGAGNGNTFVAADFGVVNNQTAAFAEVVGPVLDGEPQAALAFTQDALIALLVEDVDADSALSVSDNLIAASASGQLGTNILRNHGNGLGEDSVAVIGSFASANRQFMMQEEISAEVLNSLIIGASGVDDNINDAFGGLVGSTLAVNDNEINATATANGAAALVDLAGLSILSESSNVDGARIDSERNTGFAPHTRQFSDAGVNLSNWQFLDLPGDGEDGTVSALLDTTEIRVAVNNDDGAVDDTELLEVADSTISLDGNSLIAAASLNSYSGTANVAADTTLEASVAALSFQATSSGGEGLHIVGATVTDDTVIDNDRTIFADVGVNGDATDLSITVDANDVLALAAGNNSSQTIDASAATSILAGSGETAGSAVNAIIEDNVGANVNIETRVTDIAATAAFLAVSDQTLRVTQGEADVTDISIQLVLAGIAADPVDLADTTLSASDNALISQVLGNNASNSIALDAGTSIVGGAGDTTGAVAGIVSSQSTIQQIEDGQEATTGQSFFEANLAGNSVVADVLPAVGAPNSVTDLTLEVNDNFLQAQTFANVVDNEITASANTFTAANSGGVEVIAAHSVSGDDLDLSVDDAGLYIINRQRNEANDTDFQGGPTAESFVADNQVLATVNGGVVGLADSTVELNGNQVLATAAGTVASNSIAINPGETVEGGTSADVAAAIINRQGNSASFDFGDGDVGITADHEETDILLNVNAVDGATHDGVTLNVDANVIGSSATGNSATNSIVAQAATSLNGTNADTTGGVFIGLEADDPGLTVASIQTDTATFDSNADSFANGNLAILNTQRNYGIPGGNGAAQPSVIHGEVEGADILLNVNNPDIATTDSTLSLSGNQVRSQAAANLAFNSVSALSGTGGPEYATVLNNQGVADTQVSSLMDDAGIGLAVEGDFSNGTIGVNNNTVVSSAELNSSTNTVQAQSTVGSLPSATVVNYQTSTDSSVSSLNAGTNITVSAGVGGGGVVSGSSVSLSGNQIGSSATINNSTNTISSPGQTFTRTSSF